MALEIPLSSALQIRAGLKRRDFTVQDVARAALDRARACEDLGIFLELDSTAILAEAERLDQVLLDRGPEGPLFGVPIAIKDNLSQVGASLTCGSRMLEGFRPLFTATCIERLQEAGALLFGRTNMDEFAMGSSNENSAFFPCRNPRNPNRVPGGSSGGSAAAVAARIVPLALGSDTGGSIRLPASFCGVHGLKPTYGTVSRYGLVAFASSLDQVGPFANSSEDLALLAEVLVHEDPKDATSRPHPDPDFRSHLESRRLPSRVGWIQDEALSGEVQEAMERARTRLEGLGIESVEVSLPSRTVAVEAYYVLASAEASSNLARFDGLRYGSAPASPEASLEETLVRNRTRGFGPEVQRRILLGTFVLSRGYSEAWYERAIAWRRQIRSEYEVAFQAADVLVGPTAGAGAFRLAEKSKDPVSMYRTDTYTTPANLAGVPALSLPWGEDSEGLPLGLQLTGPEFSEGRLLALAHALCNETPADG